MQGQFNCMHRTNDDIHHVYQGFLTDICDSPDRPEIILSDNPPLSHHKAYRLNFDHHGGHGYWAVDRLDRDLISCIAKSGYCDDFNITYRALRDHFTIRFMASGAIDVNVRGKQSYRVPAGKISLHHVHKNEIVDVTYPRGTVLSCVTLYVSAGYIQTLRRLLPRESRQNFQEILNDSFGLAGRELALEPYDKNLICQLQNLTASGELKRYFIKSKTRELLCALLKNYASPAGQTDRTDSIPQTEKFKRVFDLLEQNYISPPSTQELSRKIGLNRTMLRRGFRATYGKSISQHCLERRMSRACELLSDKQRNITQIAEELGYGHSTNFTASFKRYFGILPKDYRSHYSM